MGLVAGRVGALKREVTQRGEMGFDPVEPRRAERHVRDLDVEPGRGFDEDSSPVGAIAAEGADGRARVACRVGSSEFAECFGQVASCEFDDPDSTMGVCMSRDEAPFGATFRKRSESWS